MRAITLGPQVLVREGIIAFADHDIPRSLRLTLSDITVGQLQVETVEHLPPEDTAWNVPTPDLHALTTTVSGIPADKIAGLRIGGDQPKYPGVAKAAHLQGTVVLHAVIDKSGHIRDLTPVSSPDKILTEAATNAVAKWTYKPYEMNGAIVEVDTTISVTFNLGKKKK